VKNRGGFKMNQRVMRLFLIILFILLSFSKSLQAAGKPDVTRHEAYFLESAVNVHVEWQSPNPVVLVKISVAGIEKEIKIDAYDNKRNRDGYAGEINVNVGLDRIPRQPLTYVIQLEDELRIKSPLVTGKVDVPQTERPGGRQVGTIIVILGPSTIVGSGAMWRVENGPWKKSGESFSNLPVGMYTIEFQEVGNWIRPKNQKVTIEAGKTVTINMIYNSR
jgi:hypothetical protein